MSRCDPGQQDPDTPKWAQPISSMNNSHRTVCGLILAVALIDSLAATAIALADRPPLEIGIGLLFGSAIGGAIVSLTLAPQLLSWWRRTNRPTGSRIWNRPLRLMILGRLDWPLFIISANWIGTAATAIIWGIKPIMTVIFLRQLVRGDDGKRYYQPLAKTAWFWLGLAGIGVVLVVVGRASQAGAGSWLTALGGGLAGVGSAVCAGLAAVRFDWGFRLLRPLPPADRQQLELPVIIAGVTMIGAVVGAGLLLVYGLAGNWPTWEAVWPGLLIGLVFTSGGWSLATAAWLKTRRLEVGGLFYLTPIVTVVLLTAVGQLGQINPWLFGVGSLLVLGSSLTLTKTGPAK